MSRELIVVVKEVSEPHKFEEGRYEWKLSPEKRTLEVIDTEKQDVFIYPYEGILWIKIKHNQVPVKKVNMSPPTEKQKALLRKLGVSEEEIDKLTRKAASQKIKELLKEE